MATVDMEPTATATLVMGVVAMATRVMLILVMGTAGVGIILGMEAVGVGIILGMEAVGVGVILVIATAGLGTTLLIAEARWTFENPSSRMRTACVTTEDPPLGSEARLHLPCLGATRAGQLRWEAATATTLQVGKAFSSTNELLLNNPCIRRNLAVFYD